MKKDSRRVTALALLAFPMLAIVGCGAVMEYDRMQEENDRQALIRDYRQCASKAILPIPQFVITLPLA